MAGIDDTADCKVRRDLPAPEYLRSRLRYDPETGTLFWRECAEMPDYWNSKRAGRAAFTTIAKNGYLQGAIDNKKYYAHRVAWAIVHGAWPAQQVDHVNHQRADNRLANLRTVEHAENGKNQRMRSTNKSGRMGVFFRKDTARWTAYVESAGKRIRLGCFATFDEAVIARSAAERKVGFHNNHGSVVA